MYEESIKGYQEQILSLKVQLEDKDVLIKRFISDKSEFQQTLHSLTSKLQICQDEIITLKAEKPGLQK